MGNKRVHITFNTPRIEGKRIFLSWEPNPLFRDPGYWIEYVDLQELHSSPDALLEAYLPVCLAFSVLGDIAIHLPSHIDYRVLECWNKICTDTSRILCKRTARIEFIVPKKMNEEAPKNRSFKETALIFGGGSESLLTLARLLDKKISPYLVSLWGEHWSGSNPDINRGRFVLEEKLCQEFKLKIIRIHTNVKTIYDKRKIKPYLRQGVYFVNAALFLPINISVLLPVAEQLNLGTITSGNEMENSLDMHYYSFSSAMIKNLNLCGQYVEYRSHLENLTKIEILKELHIQYPHIAKYQYSCNGSINQRWCLNCEKCLRNYLAYKTLEIDPMTVGMDESKLLENLRNIIRQTKQKIHKCRIMFEEWDGIRREAITQDKKEIINIINSVYGHNILRKIKFFFRGRRRKHRRPNSKPITL